MSEDDKPSQPQPASSSESVSPLRDADSLLRELTKTLHALRQQQEDSEQATRAERKKGEFRERMMQNALDKSTAEIKLARGEITALRARVDSVVRLSREVVTGEREVIERAAKRLDESAKFLTLPRESEEEITARVLKRWGMGLAHFLAQHGVLLKMAGAAVAAAGGVIAALKWIWHKF
jgi:hypothetical protein